MSWETITTLVEIAGVVAIVLSLIFVGRQFRQSSEQSLLTAYIQTTERFSSSSQNAGVLTKGHAAYDTLTEAELFQYSAFMIDMFSALALLWEQSHDKLVGSKTYDRAIFVAAYHFAQPGCQRFLMGGETINRPIAETNVFESWERRGLPRAMLEEVEQVAIREFGMKNRLNAHNTSSKKDAVTGAPN